MSAVRDLLRRVLARVAGALSFNKSASLAADPGEGAAEATPPAVRPVGSEYNEHELRDRERELRILMSNWM